MTVYFLTIGESWTHLVLTTSWEVSYIALHHYGNVKWPAWRLEFPLNPVCVQHFVQTTYKETSKVHVTVPFWGEYTSDRWIPHTKGTVMWKMFPFDDGHNDWLHFLSRTSSVSAWVSLLMIKQIFSAFIIYVIGSWRGYSGFTLSVRGQNNVCSVSPTIPAGPISYLLILSTNCRRCVACLDFKKFQSLKFCQIFFTSWLSTSWSKNIWQNFKLHALASSVCQVISQKLRFQLTCNKRSMNWYDVGSTIWPWHLTPWLFNVKFFK